VTPAINFFSTSNIHTPLHDMELEHPLVHLVEEIGCYAGENVTIWQVYPEWCVNRVEPVLIKCGVCVSLEMCQQIMFDLCNIPQWGLVAIREKFTT
jgi:hypothetical protein